MAAPIQSILADEAGWEKKVRELAAAGREFWLLNMQASHFDFCQQLCHEFNYQYDFNLHTEHSVATFRPTPQGDQTSHP